MDLNYSRSEWDAALEAAEIAAWDSIDAGEQYGPLAQWICDQVIDHKNVARDSDRIEAAFEALASKDETEFSPERLITVLDSWRGETENDFEKLARDCARDDYTGPDNPQDTGWVGFTSERDYEEWYVDHGQTEGEICVETSAGSSLYWFDTNKW